MPDCLVTGATPAKGRQPVGTVVGLAAVAHLGEYLGRVTFIHHSALGAARHQELIYRLCQASPQAALRYHATRERDATFAEAIKGLIAR